jgi:hypothetical protein
LLAACTHPQTWAVLFAGQVLSGSEDHTSLDVWLWKGSVNCWALPNYLIDAGGQGAYRYPPFAGRTVGDFLHLKGCMSPFRKYHRRFYYPAGGGPALKMIQFGQLDRYDKDIL